MVFFLFYCTKKYWFICAYGRFLVHAINPNIGGVFHVLSLFTVAHFEGSGSVFRSSQIFSRSAKNWFVKRLMVGTSLKAKSLANHLICKRFLLCYGRKLLVSTFLKQIELDKEQIILVRNSIFYYSYG